MTIRKLIASADENGYSKSGDFLSQGDSQLIRSSEEDEDNKPEEDACSSYETFNWEKEKQKKLHFFDDGTKSYFW